MYVKFWGTRGSIPVPGSDTIIYGGNTSCIEIRSQKGTLLVIDCGTGSYALGQKLLEEAKNHPLRGHLLISHTHWDHIQGFPFFAPLFLPGSEWNIYGPQGLRQSISVSLAGQMQHNYFPIEMENLTAKIHYHDLVEGIFDIDDIKIQTHYLNHTTLTIGYRFTIDQTDVVYACDHEPYSQHLAIGKGEINGREIQHVQFLEGADLVIHDSQYLAKEYVNKIGWGHSTIEYAIRICQEAHVKKLALTHHDPLRTDDSLDIILEQVQKDLRESGSTLEVFAAREGQELTFKPAANKPRKQQLNSANSCDIKSALSNQYIILCVKDEEITAIFKEILDEDGIFYEITNSDSLINEVLAKHPSVVIIENTPPDLEGIELCRELHQLSLKRNLSFSVVMVSAEEENPVLMASHGILDWLRKPFSVNYARSKLHAWIMRTVCRWVRAPYPKNEKERQRTLEKLGILDNGTEERFDKITRIAAALLNVPLVMVSFVDKDRQWFKAHYGLTQTETSREISLCSHVVYTGEQMIVQDTLLDDRFADNPFVLTEPHIRFYAGFPIIYESQILGTLCFMDNRPKQLNTQEIKLMEDLRDLVVRELTLGQPA